MRINSNGIKPYSPEHYAFFLGWLYVGNQKYKEKIWKKIISGDFNHLEFDEFIITIDNNKKLLVIESIYCSSKKLSYFSSDDWNLIVSFNEFKRLIGLWEVDYDCYYKVLDDIDFALQLLEFDEYRLLLKNEYKNIRSQIIQMKESMDLNVFVPTYHKQLPSNTENDFLLTLHQLALDYIKHAKPIDIISQSKLGVNFSLGYD